MPPIMVKYSDSLKGLIAEISKKFHDEVHQQVPSSPTRPQRAKSTPRGAANPKAALAIVNYATLLTSVSYFSQKGTEPNSFW
ncbi:hypothetical protein CEXT_553211 [Caerostris extrusa]|uniref:Uncharacterized protein n=1 Tax=Caerostris extrusa TaxID=172846 RepID=A0AAV4V9V5_CAEEX|nr:hypothetical protein CEXT_553211 [Caerostris extrusa]